ncbi:MAG: DNA recombination protein RmuC [Candidatus Omnitrophota bacterium]|nr:DNA recombination protein RmuC [Candidatus Omnitrophota bacterium]
MMEIIVLILLLVLIVLVAFLVRRMYFAGSGKERLEAFLSDKFVDFSTQIRETMDNTRKEVESSKDILSSHTIKTLEHIKSMNETVGTLVSQQEKVEKLGQSLEYLLQAPKLRGSYGEAILEEMLERVLPKGIWERQYSIDGNERVDAVVKFKDVVIPIDSKFPKDDYQKYLSAKDPNEKKAHWANYEKALKIQINSIKDKYVKPEKGTSEFALLFIPSESMYYETIAEKNYLGDPCQIYEYASDRKVIPVSPNTFYAFLNVVMLGVRNIEIAREAKKLQESLSRVEKDFGLFYKKFDRIGKSLDDAREAYRIGDDHVQRFKRNLESAIKLDTDFRLEDENKPRIEGEKDQAEDQGSEL